MPNRANLRTQTNRKLTKEKPPQKAAGLGEAQRKNEKGKENNAKLKIRLKRNRCKRNKQKEMRKRKGPHYMVTTYGTKVCRA